MLIKKNLKHSQAFVFCQFQKKYIFEGAERSSSVLKRPSSPVGYLTTYATQRLLTLSILTKGLDIQQQSKILMNILEKQNISPQKETIASKLLKRVKLLQILINPGGAVEKKINRLCSEGEGEKQGPRGSDKTKIVYNWFYAFGEDQKPRNALEIALFLPFLTSKTKRKVLKHSLKLRFNFCSSKKFSKIDNIVNSIKTISKCCDYLNYQYLKQINLNPLVFVSKVNNNSAFSYIVEKEVMRKIQALEVNRGETNSNTYPWFCSVLGQNNDIDFNSYKHKYRKKFILKVQYCLNRFFLKNCCQTAKIIILKKVIDRTPKKTRIFTVTRSPFVFKKTREQFDLNKISHYTTIKCSSNSYKKLLLQYLSTLKLNSELKINIY